MRIGNRLFPYPVLNQKNHLSAFEEETFKLQMTSSEDGSFIIEGQNVVFKDVHFDLSSKYLMSLYKEEKINCHLIVECPKTIYRKTFEISPISQDIKIDIGNFNGEVEVSAYMYTTQKIEDFATDEFEDLYKNYEFTLEPYHFIAINDGYRFIVDVDDEEDNKIDSVFSIVKSERNDKHVSYDANDSKIIIYLNEETFEQYALIKDTIKSRHITFSMLLIPVLSQALQTIQRNDEYEETFEILHTKSWFNSIIKRYESIKDEKLTPDIFRQYDTYVLAQELVDYPTAKGFKDLEEIMLPGGNIYEDY